jgi:hypothetical protein
MQTEAARQVDVALSVLSSGKMRAGLRALRALRIAKRY